MNRPVPERLTPADLERIRERHTAAPPGPWIATRYLAHCWCVHSGAMEEPSGKLVAADPGSPVVYVLAHDGGRRFVVASIDDIGRLLDHVEQLEIRVLELEARLRLARGES